MRQRVFDNRPSAATNKDAFKVFPDDRSTVVYESLDEHCSICVSVYKSMVEKLFIALYAAFRSKWLETRYASLSCEALRVLKCK